MSTRKFVLVLTCPSWRHGIGYYGKSGRVVATAEDALQFTSAERAMDKAKREGLKEAWKIREIPRK